jgi:hypothetical protein
MLTRIFQDHITPYEVLQIALYYIESRKPSIDYLRVLGSKVYVTIPKQARELGRKFDSRASIGILVGFNSTKQYRVQLNGRVQVIAKSIINKFDKREPLVIRGNNQGPIP